MIGLNGQEIPSNARISFETLILGKWQVVARFPYQGVNAVVPVAICYSPREAADTAQIWRETI